MKNSLIWGKYKFPKNYKIIFNYKHKSTIYIFSLTLVKSATLLPILAKCFLFLIIILFFPVDFYVHLFIAEKGFLNHI